MIDFKSYLIESIELDVIHEDKNLLLAYDIYRWLNEADESDLNKVDSLNKKPTKQRSDSEILDPEKQDKLDQRSDSNVSIGYKEEGDEDEEEKKANDWFFDLSNAIKSNRKSSGKQFTNYRRSNAVMIGRVMAFNYDPKTKSELPFFDENPLAIPFSFKDGVESKGFLAVNLHYIPRYQRKSVMNYFIKNDPVEAMKTGKLDVDYIRDIKSKRHDSKLKYLYYAIRMYLLDHVKGSFFIVPQEDYINVISVYSGKFVGQTEREIVLHIKNKDIDDKYGKYINKGRDRVAKRKAKEKTKKDTSKPENIVKINKTDDDRINGNILDKKDKEKKEINGNVLKTK